VRDERRCARHVGKVCLLTRSSCQRSKGLNAGPIVAILTICLVCTGCSAVSTVVKRSEEPQVAVADEGEAITIIEPAHVEHIHVSEESTHNSEPAYLDWQAPLETTQLELKPGETATARALELTARVQELEAEKKRLKQQIKTLEQQLKQKDIELREARKAVTEANAEIAQVRAQLARWQQEVEEIRNRLEADAQNHLEVLRATASMLESLVPKTANEPPESGQDTARSEGAGQTEQALNGQQSSDTEWTSQSEKDHKALKDWLGQHLSSKKTRSAWNAPEGSSDTKRK